MKKFIGIAILAFTVLSADAGSILHLVDDFFQVGIYCDTHQMTYIGGRLTSLNGVTILGDVSTSGEIMTVLCVVTVGDTSLQTLKEQALRKYPDADDIINIEVDNHVFGILGCVYKKVVVTLRGKAVRYDRRHPGKTPEESKLQK